MTAQATPIPLPERRTFVPMVLTTLLFVLVIGFSFESTVLRLTLFFVGLFLISNLLGAFSRNPDHD